MEIQTFKIEQLNPAVYNPRKALKPGDPEFEKLQRSIENFGFVELIVINKQTGNTVISGHQRLSVVKHLNWSEVECVVVDIDKDKEKALNIALNKVSGAWDNDKLLSLITDLKESAFDVSLTGFDAAEIEDLFTRAQDKTVKEDTFDIDGALDDGTEPFVQMGDIWLLGRHRLVCGDSTVEDTVSKLMDGKKANLCLTDPPYNCDISGGTGLKIMNDNMGSVAFKDFLLKAFKNMYNNLADGGAFYCFHSDAEKVNFFNATVEAGFHYSTTCIWVKNSLVIGRMDYQMRHEPILYAFKDTAKHKWFSDRKQTTIWDFDRPTRSILHPTTKPINLISYPLTNSSAVNGIVIDLFGGSGSTLIACEQLDRTCYMAELDPKYASVIVQRYIDFVGSSAGVFLERNGTKTLYDEVAGVAQSE